MHCDHFDPKTLSKYKNKNTKIIIKDFSDQILKRRILRLGFTNIIECKPWKKIKLNLLIYVLQILFDLSFEQSSTKINSTFFLICLQILSKQSFK